MPLGRRARDASRPLQGTTGIWWFRDEGSGNLFVHGCHPSAARQAHFTEAALDRTVLLARNLLPRFA